MTDSFFATLRSRFSCWSMPFLSGILLGVSFPSYPFIRLEILSWIAFVPLLLSLQKEQGFGRTFREVWLAMLVFSSVSLWWISLATLPGGLAAILAHSLFMTVPFLAFFAVKRRRGFRFALVALPFFWTTWEWVYIQQDLSFGWLTMGNSQACFTPMIQYADITGVWGISFWLLSFNVLAVLAWRQKDRGVVLHRCLAGMLLMVLLPLGYAWAVFHDGRHDGERSVRVSLVQPNVDPFKKWQQYTSTDLMDGYYRLSARAVFRDSPELVIWPETAIPFRILDDNNAGYLHSLRLLLKDWRVALLSGFPDVRYGSPDSSDARDERVFQAFNASMLLTPDFREPQVYHKVRLVPFAERVPYVEYVPWLERFTISLAGISGWGKGTGTPVMEFDSRRNGRVKLANVICYESIFPDFVSGFVRNGAQFLTVVTNDGWYGFSYGPYQHAAIARLRCVENRRAMARCANTGITACIDRYGKVYREVPWWEPHVLTAEVPLASDLAFYTRHPDLFVKTVGVVSVVLLCVAGFGRKLR